MMPVGPSNVVGLVMCFMNCRFSCAYATGVQFLSSGAAKASIYWSLIAVSSFFRSIVMPAVWSFILYVFGRSTKCGGDGNEISMSHSSRCCSRLSAQIASSRPPWNLLQCGCWYPSASISILIYASCICWLNELIISIFVVAMMSAGYLNLSPTIFVGM